MNMQRLLAAYGEQLRTYGRAVAQQFGLGLDSIRLSLAMLDREEAYPE